ncbi:MAG: response regulator receiver [Rhizobacter sp.]|nr:response regulator receiver [Rhizobacter sp.]
MSNVVVIEEDGAMRMLFCEWLEAEGLHVRGSRVRASVPQAGVDLVVVDLPNLATEAARAVQQVVDIYPGAALIGISTQLSRTLPAGSRQARALGVSSLVNKPCTRAELLAAVAAAIGHAN